MFVTTKIKMEKTRPILVLGFFKIG